MQIGLRHMKHTKRCLTTLIIKEIENKACCVMMKGKLALLHTAGQNIQPVEGNLAINSNIKKVFTPISAISL